MKRNVYFQRCRWLGARPPNQSCYMAMKFRPVYPFSLAFVKCIDVKIITGPPLICTTRIDSSPTHTIQTNPYKACICRSAWANAIASVIITRSCYVVFQIVRACVCVRERLLHAQQCDTNRNTDTHYLISHLFNFTRLGYSYAIYTMKLVAAHILRNYRLSTPLKLHELKLKLSVSFRLLNKHLIQVERRENWGSCTRPLENAVFSLFRLQFRREKDSEKKYIIHNPFLNNCIEWNLKWIKKENQTETSRLV